MEFVKSQTPIMRRRPTSRHPHGSLFLRAMQKASPVSPPPPANSSPIKMLPEELLVLIFKASQGSPNKNDELPFPIVLSHVSRLWRQMALGNSTLWTTIFAHNERSIDLVHVFLERSGQCPLDITCDFNGSEAIWYGRILEGVDEMIKHSRRWRQFHVAENYSWSMNEIISRLQCATVPQLQSLRLVGSPSAYNTAERIDRPHFISPSAALRTLELRFLPSNARPTLAEFKSIVEASPLLHTLIIHGEAIELSSPGTPENNTVIHIPSLSALSVGAFSDDGSYAERIMEIVSAPRLECLELWSLDQTEFARFCNSVGRSTHNYPALRALRLLNVEISSSNHFSSLSTAWPMLADLHILRGNNANDILSFLNGGESVHCTRIENGTSGTNISTSTPESQHQQTLPWPHLHTLTISVSVPVPTADVSHPSVALRDILTARKAHKVPVQVLCLEHRSEVPVPSVSWKDLEPLVRVHRIEADVGDYLARVPGCEKVEEEVFGRSVFCADEVHA